MSDPIVSFQGIFSIRKSDNHPIVTDEDGNVFLVSSASTLIIESHIIKCGDKVSFINKYSKYGLNIMGRYCCILCPICGHY